MKESQKKYDKSQKSYYEICSRKSILKQPCLDIGKKIMFEYNHIWYYKIHMNAKKNLKWQYFKY